LTRRLAIALLALLAGIHSLGATASLGASGAIPDERLRIAALTVAGGEENWHPRPNFRVSWKQPSGSPPQPEILGMYYLVENAAGEVVVPTVHFPVPGRVIEEVKIPPVRGVYTVAVWLEGSAGDGPPTRATIRFDDTRPPAVEPLRPPGWFRAGAEISLRIEHPQLPWPLAGIRGYAVAVDRGREEPPCATDVCSAAETDLAGGPEDDRISLGPLESGRNFARVLAVSGSGMRSAQVGSVELRVDGTPPDVRIDPLPQGWSPGPTEVRALARDAQSGMEAGAESRALTEIAVDDRTPTVSAGATALAVVHGEGVHVVTPAARDAVGNATWETGEPPAAALVRIDETAPRVVLAAHPDPADPERIEALVSDQLSGPASGRGSIEVRAVGSRQPFAPIPTLITGGKLIGTWDSDSFAAGRFEFRAVGYDAAGNRTIADRREDGSAIELRSPLKQPTQLELGFGARQLTSQRCARTHGRVRCHRRQIVALDRRPASNRVRYGRAVPLTAKLTARDGKPLVGVPVAVVEEFDAGNGPPARTSTVLSDAAGEIFTRLPPGPSRQVRVEFGGDRLRSRTRSRTLRLEAAAAVTLRASTALVWVGGTPVVFSGSVAPGAQGLAVKLEFRLPGQPWSEFRTVETDPQGRFRYPYAFSDDDSRGVRFHFRARTQERIGWPYAPGSSLPVVVAGR
jgi:hypothetical protein